MTLSRNYYAMPTEHGDDKLAETSIAALSEMAFVHDQQGQLWQAHEVCQSPFANDSALYSYLTGRLKQTIVL